MVMTLERSWHDILSKEISMPQIQKLKLFLKEEKRRKTTVYPPESLVFHAFSCTPFEKVKVVILGQDPYHGLHQAHGLCFSVQKGIPIPPSLKNIYKELRDDLGILPARHGNLEKWAKQGVLLLNATLTVREHQPRSHYGRGWEQFTDAVVDHLCQRKNPLVFILWGNSAKKKCENILSQTRHPHAVLKAAHPSPYSAAQFFGCRHFSQTNAYLKKWGQAPIDWNVD